MKSSITLLLFCVAHLAFAQCDKKTSIPSKPNIDGPDNVLNTNDSSGSIKLNHFNAESSYPLKWQWHKENEKGKVLLSGTASAKGNGVKNDMNFSQLLAEQGLIRNLSSGTYTLTVCDALSRQLQNVVYTITISSKPNFPSPNLNKPEPKMERR